MADNTQVQALYIAYFGRPADPTGLKFWSDGKKSKRADLDALADSISGTPEYTLATAGKTTEQIVNAFYQNMFNRDADLKGLEFWVNAINTGASSAEDIGVEIGLAALNAEVKKGETNTDKDAITAKAAAANLWTTEVAKSTKGILAYQGTDAVAAGNAFIQPVVSKATTPTEAATASAVQALIDENTVAAGDKLSLTVMKDVASSTNDYVALSTTNEIQLKSAFRFNSNNQTINATSSTYNANDSLVDASTTDSDTLNIDFGGGAITNTTATVTNIENLNISGSSMSGTFTQGASMTGLKSATATGAIADAATALAFSFNDGVTSVDTTGVTGGTGTKADTITIAVAGGGGITVKNGDVSARNGASIAAATAGITTGKGNDTITSGKGDDYISAGDGVNTINAGAGTNRVIGLGQSGTADTLINDVASTTTATVTGTGKVTVTATATGVTVNGNGSANTIDATTSTAAVALTGGGGGDTLTGGTGADTINGSANATAGLGDGVADVLTGGAGIDTFQIVDAGAGATGSTAAASAVAGSGANNIADGTVLTAANGGGFENITDFAAGDLLATGSDVGDRDILAANTGLVDNNNYVIRGDWNKAANTFTVSYATGADVLVFTAAGADETNAAHYGTNLTVLSNFGSSITNILDATFV